MLEKRSGSIIHVASPGLPKTDGVQHQQGRRVRADAGPLSIGPLIFVHLNVIISLVYSAVRQSRLLVYILYINLVH
jgi:hypothetical protein